MHCGPFGFQAPARALRSPDNQLDLFRDYRTVALYSQIQRVFRARKPPTLIERHAFNAPGKKSDAHKCRVTVMLKATSPECQFCYEAGFVDAMA